MVAITLVDVTKADISSQSEAVIWVTTEIAF